VELSYVKLNRSNGICALVTTYDVAFTLRAYAQNPLHTFSRNFPVDGEAQNLPTGYGLVVYVAVFRTCRGLATGKPV